MTEDARISGRSGAETFRTRVSLGDGADSRHCAFDPAWNIAVNHVAAAAIVPPKLRTAAYRLAGIDCRTVKIAPGLWVYSDLLSIEVGAFVGWHCRIHNQARVTLGARAFLGPEVMLLTTNHTIGPAEHRAGPIEAEPILVGAGAWIGARAIVLPGVTIGAGSVVAAGSLVTKDCAPNGLYAGVPAVRKRDLPDT